MNKQYRPVIGYTFDIVDIYDPEFWLKSDNCMA